MQPVIRFWTCVLLVAAVSGCSNLSQRIESAEQLALENGFHRKSYTTSLFSIVTFQRSDRKGNVITIYIEGDGRAWINRRRVSTNPTPDNPVALKLAITDNSNNVVYLARPCQFLVLNDEDNCSPEYWTSKRASTEVVTAINAVITQLKQEYRAEQIRLVGYSGGATLAAIISASREDVLDFRSVAGNLDIKAFTEYHGITPLHGSINPVSLGQELARVPQEHYYSSDDKVVTPALVEGYMTTLKQHDPNLTCLSSVRLDGISHGYGWQAYWSRLGKEVLRCQ